MNISILIALLAAAPIALAAAVAGVGILNYSRRYDKGWVYYYSYPMIFAMGLSVFFSTRDFLSTGEVFTASTNPIPVLVIKLASAFTVIASIDQMVRFFKAERKFYLDRVILLISFAIFWLTNILVPALFAPHPASLQLSWLYSLFLGIGVLSLGPIEGQSIVKHFRNSTLLFCLVSLLLIPFKPQLVLQTNYDQGYIPGLARLAGLAPQAILMGVTACLGLWCLYISPFKSKLVNLPFCMIGASTLFLTQAKNVWIAFIILTPLLVFYKNKYSGKVTSSYGRNMFAIYVLQITVFLIPIIGILLALFGAMDGAVDGILNSKEGGKLLSLTGRDAIWAVAFSEWAKSPLLGYGLPLFGDEHRSSINMLYATSGHNQIVDNLGRTGLIGTTASVLHFLIVLIVSFKYRKATHGLSLALALFIFIRMISEVPVTLVGIGLDTLPYFLLLALIGINMRFDTAKAR